jgi:hypothetical protein
MTELAILALVYLGIGAACCAHPADEATPDAFGWRGQAEIFRHSFAEVLGWPVALWRLWQG